ncbi:hypothetical protein [Williamsia sp. 1135]|uniref:hypothetical protein n=1 Tax=Williamsia sp. 1135 TaxID=1889262 RepID=UPI000A2174AC|nr:hypothetical protein [Williamsia sp. 1135]ORM38014.1 hypothetical protein BFL43_01825 [Williamsia sp. 1135]
MMHTRNNRPLTVADAVEIHSQAHSDRRGTRDTDTGATRSPRRTEPSPPTSGVGDPKLMLRVANAIEEQSDWTRVISNVSMGMWFAVAVRPGACGSLLSGLAAMYFPETEVFGDPGKAFHAAVQEALVMS